MYLLLVAITYFINPYYSPTKATAQTWQLIIKVLYFSQGYIMVLMRCTEEAFIDVIKERLQYVFSFISCKNKILSDERDELNDAIYIKRN